MKRLTKVRLINWHRFRDETIPIGESVLLSGENGAGKSTILDAIQFTITCSKAHFNVAAHEKGKRNLNSYIRCKTGREDRPYERTGPLTAHIALEFFDEARNKPFVIGVVMDSASEEKEPNTAWYLMDNRAMKEEWFHKGTRLKGISAFRATNKDVRQFCTTIQEARKMILARFGRLEDKFFSLIPKALAFKPIHDIKDFVYSYVLDEKEVNIEVLRENVRSYQELEKMLADVRARIRELEYVIEKEREVETCLRRDRMQGYYLARGERERIERAIRETKQKIREEELRAREWTQKKEELARKRDQQEEIIRDLAAALKSNSEYQALQSWEKQESALKIQLEEDRRGVKELMKAAKTALKDTDVLMEFSDADASLKEYRNYLETLAQCESLVEVTLCLEKVIRWKNEMYSRIQERLAELRVETRKVQTELAELDHQIRELEARRLIYPEHVTKLSGRIREELRRLSRNGEVRILCEMLEITDPSWQNAVEGYLGTQRFYLLTDPEDFDIAVSIYDRMREKKQVYGVGLIHAEKLREYDEVPEGSLAEVVSSKNIWAKRYVNMILGRVHRCKNYQELKQYPIAITRQCMRYQNHVVSAIRPEVFRTPYIGQDAYKAQLAQKKARREELQQERSRLTERTGEMAAVSVNLMTEHDIDVRYRLHFLEEKRRHEAELAECRDAMKKLSASETMIQQRIQMETLSRGQRDLNAQIEETAAKIGGCESRREQGKQMLDEYSEAMKGLTDELLEQEKMLGDALPEAEKEYGKQTAGRELPVFLANMERARKQTQTLKQKYEDEMRAAMRAYKVAHDFGAADTLAGFPDFQAEYEKLKGSRLLEYEEKVTRARQAAEEEFREQFLSRLQENIRQAQNEFKDLNRALADIRFSKEQYEFRFEPNRRLKKYYQMIMDDFNVMGGTSIFSGAFHEQHREVIDELFSRLALDEDADARTLQEYTDYRTYMDYDICITMEDGGYMLYSKVSREKSGGETQTPFYITIAASFIQLYRNSIGGDAVGLVMMDEAFNNMDDERMAGVMSFLNQAGLQMIIAAPPEKIQFIGPSVKQVLLVLQDGEASYVEEYAAEGV